MSLFMNTLQCSSLFHLIIEPKFRLELGFLAKKRTQTSIFLSRAQAIYKQLGSFTIYFGPCFDFKSKNLK